MSVLPGSPGSTAPAQRSASCRPAAPPAELLAEDPVGQPVVEVEPAD